MKRTCLVAFVLACGEVPAPNDKPDAPSSDAPPGDAPAVVTMPKRMELVSASGRVRSASYTLELSFGHGLGTSAPIHP